LTTKAAGDPTPICTEREEEGIIKAKE